MDVYIKEKERIERIVNLQNVSLINNNSSKKKKHYEIGNDGKVQLVKDLTLLSLGWRNCILIDYPLRTTNNYLDNIFEKLNTIKCLKIQFKTILNGIAEEMEFIYFINYENLLSYLKGENIFKNRIIVNVDKLISNVSNIINNVKVKENILFFLKLLSNEIINSLITNKNKLNIHLNLYQNNNFIDNNYFIPFDCTLMNGFLLNYPILYSFESRFDKENYTTVNFTANHLLNSISLMRFNIFCNETRIINFTIPQHIITSKESIILEEITKWKMLYYTNNNFQLLQEIVEHDSIVL
ncbi:hypothetical protein ABK040_007229 [Willaertia magna]